MSAVVIGIPSAIIKSLLKKEKKGPQIAGIALFFLVYLLTIYSILVIYYKKIYKFINILYYYYSTYYY